MKGSSKFSQRPITSPVDSISGPSSVSAPEKLMKGNTVSLTETDFSVSYENLISVNFYSSISQVVYFPKGCPIGLLKNGTVL